MSVINLSLEHRRPLPEARARLAQVVGEVSSRFAQVVRRVEWSEDRSQVTLAGTGFEVKMRVDLTHFHLTGDIPLLSSLFGGPLNLALRTIAEKHFPPRLA